MPKTTERVRICASRGLRGGAIFGGIALVAGLLTHGTTYRHFGIQPVAMTAIYLVAGTFGGALVGALLPLVRNSWSAAAVATVGFLPMVLMIRCALQGFFDWRLGEVVFLLGIAAVLGAIWGPGAWRAHNKELSRTSRGA